MTMSDLEILRQMMNSFIVTTDQKAAIAAAIMLFEKLTAEPKPLKPRSFINEE